MSHARSSSVTASPRKQANTQEPEHDPYTANELQSFLNSFKKEAWDTQIKSMQRLQATAQSSSSRNLLMNQVKNIMSLVIAAINNLRSMVASAGIQTACVLSQHLGSKLDSELPALLPVLMSKLTEASKAFLSDDASNALAMLVTQCTPRKVIPILLAARDVKAPSKQAGIAWLLYRFLLHYGDEFTSHLYKPLQMHTYQSMAGQIQSLLPKDSFSPRPSITRGASLLNTNAVLTDGLSSLSQPALILSKHNCLCQIGLALCQMAEDKAADARLWTARSLLLLHIILDPVSFVNNQPPLTVDTATVTPIELFFAIVMSDQNLTGMVNLALVSGVSPVLLGLATNATGSITSGSLSARPSTNSGLGSILRLLTSRDWTGEMEVVVQDRESSSPKQCLETRNLGIQLRDHPVAPVTSRQRSQSNVNNTCSTPELGKLQSNLTCPGGERQSISAVTKSPGSVLRRAKERGSVSMSHGTGLNSQGVRSSRSYSTNNAKDFDDDTLTLTVDKKDITVSRSLSFDVYGVDDPASSQTNTHSPRVKPELVMSRSASNTGSSHKRHYSHDISKLGVHSSDDDIDDILYNSDDDVNESGSYLAIYKNQVNTNTNTTNSKPVSVATNDNSSPSSSPANSRNSSNFFPAQNSERGSVTSTLNTSLNYPNNGVVNTNIDPQPCPSPMNSSRLSGISTNSGISDKLKFLRFKGSRSAGTPLDSSKGLVVLSHSPGPGANTEFPAVLPSLQTPLTDRTGVKSSNNTHTNGNNNTVGGGSDDELLRTYPMRNSRFNDFLPPEVQLQLQSPPTPTEQPPTQPPVRRQLRQQRYHSSESNTLQHNETHDLSTTLEVDDSQVSILQQQQEILQKLSLTPTRAQQAKTANMNNDSNNNNNNNNNNVSSLTGSGASPSVVLPHPPLSPLSSDSKQNSFSFIRASSFVSNQPTPERPNIASKLKFLKPRPHTTTDVITSRSSRTETATFTETLKMQDIMSTPSQPSLNNAKSAGTITTLELTPTQTPTDNRTTTTTPTPTTTTPTTSTVTTSTVTPKPQPTIPKLQLPTTLVFDD